jgi:histidinol-phosphate aminotransferase
MGFTVLPSAANFIFMKSLNVNGSDIFSALREKGILVRHFNTERISDFLRISMGTDNDMDIFLDACSSIVADLHYK